MRLPGPVDRPLPPALVVRVGEGDGRQQRAGVGVQGAGEQLGGRGHLHNLAPVHDGDAVAEVLDHGKVVGDEEDGQPQVAAELVQQVYHLRLDGHVQRGDGLVGDDQRRLHDDGAGNPYPLPLAAGELVGVAVGVLAQKADADQGLCDGHAYLPLVFDSPDAEALSDYLADCHAGVERGGGVLVDHLNLGVEAYLAAEGFRLADFLLVLADGAVQLRPGDALLLVFSLRRADRLPVVQRPRPEQLAVEPDGPTGYVVEADYGAARRRLAAAGLPDQAEHLAPVDVEADVVHRAEAPLAEPCLEVADLEEGRAARGLCVVNGRTRHAPYYTTSRGK